MAEPSPKKQLDRFLARYKPEIAALARATMAGVRARLPGAVELVYDKANALVVGFGPTEKPSEAVFSVVVFPRWVLLYFLQGAVLPDANGLLKGAGKVGRHIRLTDAATLEDPAVGELMDDAVDLADVQIGAGQKAKIVIRMAAETPRRRGSPAQN
jgi:hypothetical protein